MALVQSLRSSQSYIARAWASEAGACENDRRDVFPLPRADVALFPSHMAPEEVAISLDFVNFCVAGLNCLDAGLGFYRFAALRGSGPTAAQRTILTHVVNQSLATLDRLASIASGLSPSEVLASFEPGSSEAAPRLQADSVDLPTVAASCDPIRFIGPALRLFLEDPSQILPEHSVGVGERRAPRGSQGECARTVVAKCINSTNAATRCGSSIRHRHNS